MGKVPDVGGDVVAGVVSGWERGKEGRIPWRTFKKACNAWPWRKLSRGELQPRIDDYYAKARKAEMSGKPNEAREFATKALRIEGLDSQKEVKIQHVEEVVYEPQRVDTYTQYRLSPDEVATLPAVTTIYNSTQPLKVTPKTLRL